MARKAKKSMKAAKPKKMAAKSEKTMARPKIVKIKLGDKPFKKSQIYAHIADESGLAKKEVSAVFESLDRVIGEHLKKGGPGEFILPGILKARVHRKPATKARKGVNPFTGEEMMFKAKPARNIVKIRPLKKLKELVS